MQLSKRAYFADFAIYAFVVVVLFAAAMGGGTPAQRVQWLAAAGAGIAVWSLSEYLLHRFALHELRGIAELHAAHHESPRAYIGTPTWISLAVFGTCVFLPVWAGISLTAASGLTAGIALSYLWYGIVHHVIHHQRPRLLAAMLAGAAHRHFLHHNPALSGNFGVTTALWDHVFRTHLDAPLPLGARRWQRIKLRALRIKSPAL